jgi:hypothetical protein
MTACVCWSVFRNFILGNPEGMEAIPGSLLYTVLLQTKEIPVASIRKQNSTSLAGFLLPLRSLRESVKTGFKCGLPGS